MSLVQTTACVAGFLFTQWGVGICSPSGEWASVHPVGSGHLTLFRAGEGEGG